MGFHKRRLEIVEEIVDSIAAVIDDSDDLSNRTTWNIVYDAVISCLSDMCDNGRIGGSYTAKVYAPFPNEERIKGLEVEVALYHPRGTTADNFIIPVLPPKEDPIAAYNRAMRIF